MESRPEICLQTTCFRANLTRSFLLTACLISGMSLVGCADSDRQTHPVTGLVRFTDGKLLRDGNVEFEIVGRDQPVTATGAIGPDGTFVLGTYEADDGALAGKHRVVVIADHVIGTGAERPGLIPEPTLHSKYREYRTTDLVAEVKPGPNQVVLEVEYVPVEEDDEKSDSKQPTDASQQPGPFIDERQLSDQLSGTNS